MKKRKDKIEQKYGAYKIKFAGKSKEEMEESIDNLTEQIEEKNNLLRKTRSKEERENLETIIKKMEQEKSNLEGYSKNKEKIEKIREYKAKLNERMEPLKQQKNVLKAQLEDHKKNNKERLENINKILKDPKVTEKMDNMQYNNLMLQKEKIEKERQEIENKIKDIQKRIDTLTRGTSKCDLAWRSLFNNKSWDEIHLRAMNDKRFTRKTADEKTVENKEENQNNKERENESEGQEMAKVSEFETKHPRLAKLFNKVKNRFKKVSNLIKRNSPDDKVNEEETKNKRDAFIEQLQGMVEKDGKVAKEKAYIEKHKPKVKVKNEEEQEI